jgi:triphosphatase
MRRTEKKISCRFELDPQDCDWLLARLARFGAKARDETRDFALYLDTPEAAIGNHGLALGTHRGGEITSDQVKTAVNRAARGQPATKAWTRLAEPLSAATPVGALRWLRSFMRRQDAEQSLRILFQIETRSRRWHLTTDGAKAEISLDRARITASRKQASFAVVSFTCESSPTDFFRVLGEICDPAKLRMSSEALTLRGYRLGGNLRESHVTAFAPKLAANMDVATAFQSIARSCFDQFLLNETAIRLSRNREAVHQCRVALRRLFTSLRLFSSLVSGDGRDELWPALKQLAGYLRKARDLDVLIADVIEPAVATNPLSGATDLLRAIEARRNLAYDQLAAALCAPETAELYARLVAWIEAGDWTLDPEREKARREEIATLAARKLAQLTRKFKNRCDALEEADQEGRHHIRIRAKNLRYSGEFFEALVAPKSPRHKAAHQNEGRMRFRAFVAALKDLQTILGKENDVRMARGFLASLADEIGEGRVADVDKVAPATIDSLAVSIKGLSEAEFQRKAGKARRIFGKLRPFWSEICSVPASRPRRVHRNSRIKLVGFQPHAAPIQK